MPMDFAMWSQDTVGILNQQLPPPKNALTFPLPLFVL